MTSDSNIDRKILRCIEDGLEILGNSGKKAMYYYLEKNIGLKKEEIPEKPETFSRGLTMIFGEEGTAIIEKNLVKKLALCFKLNQQPEISLTDAVATIRTRHETLRE